MVDGCKSGESCQQENASLPISKYIIYNDTSRRINLVKKKRSNGKAKEKVDIFLRILFIVLFVKKRFYFSPPNIMNR